MQEQSQTGSFKHASFQSDLKDDTVSAALISSGRSIQTLGAVTAQAQSPL